jgi:chromosome segregation ATPase
MNLLSQPQGKSKHELDIADQERRIIQLDGLIVKKRKELEELDATFVRNLSEKGAQNYEEEQNWRQRIDSLRIEVEALESRRKSALVPLEERGKKVEDRERVLLQREEQAALKESDIEYTSQALENRLDEISEREQESISYEKRLSERDMVLKIRESELETRMAALTEVIRQVLLDAERAKAEASERKALLRGRDISITEREQSVARQEASFVNRERAILDRYQTLQRAITETNLKYPNVSQSSAARTAGERDGNG